ncbi:hypothetical protein [Candidatus Tisiphia endosymbiont of Ptychoptera albimana]|uniref:hypothetical protein n=1 Tax=Candidatus Tisiphia endosymbiont of Ptychoptera albimana TaxID=3066260 RepID=UPI00312C6F63
MAKSKSNPEKDLNTADDFYKLGEQEYKIRGEILTTGIGTKAEKEGYGVLAAGSFYQALALGHQKAPFSLYACFGQGIGVDQDDNLAAMMFGVAQNLKDPRCKNLKVKIPKSMENKVKELTKLVKETQSKIPAEGVSTDKLLEQMAIFQSIKIPSGEPLQSCFSKKSTTHDKGGASTSAHNASYETCPDTSLESFEDQGDVAMGGVTHLHVCCSVM